MSETTVLDFTPWVGRYRNGINWQMPPPADASLPAMIRTTTRRFARGKAFTCVMPNGMYGTLSFEEVDRMSDDFAVYLREALKLDAGKRVALQVPNSLVTPVAVFGILKAGCVLVNVNPLYTADEMKQQLVDSGAEALIITDMFADKLAAIRAELPVRHVVLASLPSFFPSPVRQIVQCVLRWWQRVLPRHDIEATTIEEAVAEGARLRQTEGHAAQRYWEGLGHDDLAILQYTGGTTGAPKGAMLSHGNLLWNIEQLKAMGSAKIIDGAEVVLTALPLYHIFAFTTNLLGFYSTGAHNILVPNPRPIRNLQRAFDNYRITWISGVNTLYNALLNEEWFHAFPPRHLKASIGGGAPMNAAVIKRWENLTGSRLLEGYGLTETAPLVSFQPILGEPRTNTIGIPAPCTDVRLVDEQGRLVPQGLPGELVVRGPQVMHGYWKLPGETAQVLRDGWFHTGDIAVMDADFNFRIIDRKKDLILVSGFNVYPSEVEEVISSNEKVMEAAVVGVPCLHSGEEVVAYVVRRDPSLGITELDAHCRAHLTAYKVPARFLFVPALPKTSIGKVLRRELRARASESPKMRKPPDAATAVA
ncbi:MAG TPA: AMP-binding protein [Noviherbaspirillum sp.]